MDSLNRLAVLSQEMNLRKGIAFRGGKFSVVIKDLMSQAERLEYAYSVMRIDPYMIDEMDAFGATEDGINDILAKLDQDIKKATAVLKANPRAKANTVQSIVQGVAGIK